MKKPRIHFIITGGTIDSSYDPPTETSIPNEESVIPHYITEVIKPHFKSSFETLCMVNSRDMTDPTRKKILKAVLATEAPYIVITHGTTSMTKTIKFLDKHKGEDFDKILIVTGSMIPLKDSVLSDGGFNIGFAIGALSSLEPGIYLAMNGRIFKPGESVKNIDKARFEEK